MLMMSKIRVFIVKVIRLIILRIRKTIFKSYQKRYINKKHTIEYEPIFVIGANRSGTAVCTKLLEGHPLILETHIDKNIAIDFD